MSIADLGGLLGSEQTQSQIPLETEEQKRARKLLLEYAQSGQFGNITAGEDLGLPMGNYTPTDLEQAGLSRLRTMLGETGNQELDMARSALGDLLSTSEANINKQFDPFAQTTARSIRESQDALKRASAFGGNLYSTNTIQNLGDIGARGNELMATKMAELTNQALDRRLQAIPLATSLARTTEDINMGRIGASQTYGSLERLLDSAKQEAERQEILRKRAEVMGRISAASGVGSSQVEWGVPEVTTYTNSPFANLLAIAAQTAGSYYGGKAGASSGK